MKQAQHASTSRHQRDDAQRSQIEVREEALRADDRGVHVQAEGGEKEGVHRELNVAVPHVELVRVIVWLQHLLEVDARESWASRQHSKISITAILPKVEQK